MRQWIKTPKNTVRFCFLLQPSSSLPIHGSHYFFIGHLNPPLLSVVVFRSELLLIPPIFFSFRCIFIFPAIFNTLLQFLLHPFIVPSSFPAHFFFLSRPFFFLHTFNMPYGFPVILFLPATMSTRCPLNFLVFYCHVFLMLPSVLHCSPSI